MIFPSPTLELSCRHNSQQDDYGSIEAIFQPESATLSDPHGSAFTNGSRTTMVILRHRQSSSQNPRYEWIPTDGQYDARGHADEVLQISQIPAVLASLCLYIYLERTSSLLLLTELNRTTPRQRTVKFELARHVSMGKEAQKLLCLHERKTSSVDMWERGIQNEKLSTTEVGHLITEI